MSNEAAAAQWAKIDEYLDLATAALHEAMQNGDLDKADTGPKYPTFTHPDEPVYPAK